MDFDPKQRQGKGRRKKAETPTNGKNMIMVLDDDEDLGMDDELCEEEKETIGEIVGLIHEGAADEDDMF
jgi:hypothetical protein